MTTTGGEDINLAPENDHDDDTLGGDNVDLDGHDDGSGDTTAQANVIPAQGGGGNGPTNFNLRVEQNKICLLYTSPSPRDRQKSRMPSSA